MGTVKESVEQIRDKLGEVENTMEKVINMKLDNMKEEQKVKERYNITKRFNWVF